MLFEIEYFNPILSADKLIMIREIIVPLFGLIHFSLKYFIYTEYMLVFLIIQSTQYNHRPVNKLSIFYKNKIEKN